MARWRFFYFLHSYGQTPHLILNAAILTANFCSGVFLFSYDRFLPNLCGLTRLALFSPFCFLRLEADLLTAVSIDYCAGINWISPVYCNLLFLASISIDTMQVSFSSALVLVKLYAPMIFCKHLCWMDLTGLTILSGFLSLAPAIDKIYIPTIKSALFRIKLNAK